MAIKDIFKKLSGDAEKEPPKKGLSSAEVEVMSFREQQRQDEIKEELRQFREKASKDFLGGGFINRKDTITTMKPTIFKNKSMKTKKNLLGNGSILKQKSVFFK